MDKKRVALTVVILSALASMTLVQPAAAATQLDARNVNILAADPVTPGTWVLTSANLHGIVSSWYISAGHYKVIFDGDMGAIVAGSVCLGAYPYKIVSVQTWGQYGIGLIVQQSGGGVGTTGVAFQIYGATGCYLKVIWDFTTSSSSVHVSLSVMSANDYQSGYFDLALYNPGGGGGCPNLLVWNGKGFSDEGVLSIHNLANPESDVVVQHTLAATPALADHNRYTLKLAEIGAGYNYSHSWLDQVKLYAVDGEGGNYLCPLVFANSSRYGDVLPMLLRSDDVWAQTLKGDEITLQFRAPRIDNVAQFIFVIEGHNIKTQ